MISGSRRSPNHPSHPPRNLTRTSSEIRPSQTLNPSAPSFIPSCATSLEKQSSVRHKTPPHKLCSLNICHVNIRSLLAESRLIELESLCAAQNIDVLCLRKHGCHPHVLNPVQVWSTFQDSSHPFDRIVFMAAAEESLSTSGMV